MSNIIKYENKRFPSLIERFLLNITCIGFCEGNDLTYLHACKQNCLPKPNLLKEDTRIKAELK